MFNKSVIVTAVSIISAVVLLSVGFVTGSLVTSNHYQSFLGAISLKREDNPAFPFAHPILGINTPDAGQVDQFGSLTKKVQAVFNANKAILSRYSVYFRDQNNGFWVGINEDDTYNPASMLKVALAIAVYKQAEKDPSFLTESRVYTPVLAAINQDLSFALPTELQVGKAYKIEDLVNKMIVDSDNGAKDILGNTVDPKIMSDVYNYLSIAVPKDGQDYTISAKKYTSFFRTLYNAAYLNQDYSNRLLDMLGRSNFSDGLVAGVPSNVPVAHKYGEYVATGDNTINAVQLHDCGIIYSPNNPYVLCVMTQGKDKSDLADVIAAVSKTVYQEVMGGYK